jgi:phosphoribosylformylglycinamidine synthase
MKVETHNHPTAISPVPGRRHRLGRRDPRRRRDRPRVQAQGGPHRVHGLEPAPAGGLQPWERITASRAASPRRSTSCSRGPSGAPPSTTSSAGPTSAAVSAPSSWRCAGRRARRGARLPQAHHDRGRARQHRAPARARRARDPAGRAHRRAGRAGMLIGLGGGAASSMASGASAEDLDFASVQRDNAEMQRRCQEVIDRCWALGDANPIVSIHDVGAGGLVERAARAGERQRPRRPVRAAQDPERRARACRRSRSGATRRRSATSWRSRPSGWPLRGAVRARALPLRGAWPRHRLTAGWSWTDAHFGNRPIDMPLAVLLGKPPKMSVGRARPRHDQALFLHPRSTCARPPSRAAPAHRRRQDLPHHHRRSHRGGLVRRDQMVGPWQVPVADAAVTAAGFDGYTGEAMAMGERTPLALLDAAASARMAVGEAITNIASRAHRALGDVKLSANWMARGRAPGRGRAPVRRRARRGIRALPRPWASPSRSARTRCRCARSGTRPASEKRDRPCRSS